MVYSDTLQYYIIGGMSYRQLLPIVVVLSKLRSILLICDSYIGWGLDNCSIDKDIILNKK